MDANKNIILKVYLGLMVSLEWMAVPEFLAEMALMVRLTKHTLFKAIHGAFFSIVNLVILYLKAMITDKKRKCINRTTA